ncbi:MULTISPECIES: lytic transglycosylase domain-containing protein [unclassified Clostridium]|uniref:lytic transglycosylase domain-containing protein n=1 Tax=unclassified Clostridium TaxID=2614128 RepID=UPI000297B92E|nr:MULTISPECIES: lytic transglycosylase domain-containing protein [unclassified Clostridium]EKQ51822.1 MAG: soluble lytic murein transglycosylase-like protein [Clostridium sp. Maddingley MBC34-26]
MAIDGLNNISNEQLLAMNLMGNGQVTNDSDAGADSTVSDESNLAFQLVMQNLMESSKKTSENTAESLKNVKNEINNKSAVNTEDTKTKNAANTVELAKAIQKYVSGQKLEDIPMILNNRYINFANNSRAFTKKSGADMEKIYSAVNSAAKKYGIDSNLLLAVIKQESDFDPNSASGVGAAGLMQIMPENFDGLGITDGYDINQNVNGGAKLLKEYLNQYNGNVEMALMAYNGGPGTMQRRGVSSAGDLYKMPLETQNYVPKVMGYYKNGF